MVLKSTGKGKLTGAQGVMGHGKEMGGALVGREEGNGTGMMSGREGNGRGFGRQGGSYKSGICQCRK